MHTCTYRHIISVLELANESFQHPPVTRQNLLRLVLSSFWHLSVRSWASADLTTALHECLDDFGQWRHVARGIWQRRVAAVRGALDGGEADVVLLDNGGVEAVEVQQEHELVIQPLLGLQDKPTCAQF